MEKENYEQLSPEEVKKFKDEHMTDEQKEVSEERERHSKIIRTLEEIKSFFSDAKKSYFADVERLDGVEKNEAGVTMSKDIVARITLKDSTVIDGTVFKIVTDVHGNFEDWLMCEYNGQIRGIDFTDIDKMENIGVSYNTLYTDADNPKTRQTPIEKRYPDIV